MSDIFISYAREDSSMAKSLAKEFESQGFSVWWDRTIPPGKTWRDVIGSALNETKCIVVLWSEYSINSQWVIAEADYGNRHAVLVPVFIQEVEPPLGFGHIQGADLTSWKLGKPHDYLNMLITSLRELLNEITKEVISDESGSNLKDQKLKQELLTVDKENAQKKISPEKVKHGPVNMELDSEVEADGQANQSLKQVGVEKPVATSDTKAEPFKEEPGESANNDKLVPELKPVKKGMSKRLVFLLILAVLGGSYGTYYLFLNRSGNESPLISDYLKPKVRIRAT